MGPFERRTTPPPPPATTERTSWLPAAPERQSWPPPAPISATERQSWAPPPPAPERTSWLPPPLDRSALGIPSDKPSSSPHSSERSGALANDTRPLRATRPPLSPRGSGLSAAVSDRSSASQTDRWYAELPLLPGEGPFQIKGLAHRGLLQYVQQRVSGGTATFLATLPNEALRDFFIQPFLASSFYDLLPLASASAFVAEMTRTPLESFAQQQGRSQALHDVQHAYRALLQGRTSDDFHLRLKPLASRYYNFGEWDVARDEANRLKVFGRGLPSWLMPWFTPMQVGYFAGLVAAMGKPHSQVHVAAVRREGTAAKLPLSSIELDILLRD